MQCPSCGRENPPGAQFCSNCGAALAGGAVQPVRYAGFWLRLLAWVIDFFVTAAGGAVVGFVIGFVAVLGDPVNGQATASSLAGLIGTIGGLAYFAIMESSSLQATVGKMAVGIRVTDLEGRRISLGRSIGRTLAKLLSGLILGIGYLMVAFTERKQGLHDMVAGCLVVKRRAN